jgi:hypothetical protein
MWSAASAQAEPITFHVTLPLHTEVTSPCSGEQVEVVEDLLLLVHLSDLDPDNRELQLLHSNTTNGTATGLTSGETYRFVSSSTSRDDFSGAPFVSTFIFRQLFVGTGTGDSFTLVIMRYSWWTRTMSSARRFSRLIWSACSRETRAVRRN